MERYAAERYGDLMKQGWFKGPSKRRQKKTPPEVVACDDCLNWHAKGKHTADAATRKANRAANKEATRRVAAVRTVPGGKRRHGGGSESSPGRFRKLTPQQRALAQLCCGGHLCHEVASEEFLSRIGIWTPVCWRHAEQLRADPGPEPKGAGGKRRHAGTSVAADAMALRKALKS